MIACSIFTADERERQVGPLVDLLGTDAQIDGVVLVGSLVNGGDQWSDIDLQISVSDQASVGEVAEGWSERAYRELPVLHHLAKTIGDQERLLCLLLDNMLEIDLAFSATANLSVYEPFRVLFDRSGAVEAAMANPPAWSAEQPDWTGATSGLWHDVLHARAAVGRGRYWQAVFYLERIRTAALRLASLRRGFYAGELNYADDLPADFLAILEPTLISTLEPNQLLTAIGAAARGFLIELRQADPLCRGSARATASEIHRWRRSIGPHQ